MVKNLNTIDKSTEVRVGLQAGESSQGSNSVAIGNSAGRYLQNTHAVAIGYLAGSSYQGSYSVAMGAYSNAQDNSIVLNATGANLHPATTDAFFVKPVRFDPNQSNIVAYNSTTGEIVDKGAALPIQSVSGTLTLNAASCYGNVVYITTNNTNVTMPPGKLGMHFRTAVYADLDTNVNIIPDGTETINSDTGAHDLRTNGGHRHLHTFICVEDGKWVTED